eukprot:6466199-Amphidinium_carterae.1
MFSCFYGNWLYRFTYAPASNKVHVVVAWIVTMTISIIWWYETYYEATQYKWIVDDQSEGTRTNEKVTTKLSQIIYHTLWGLIFGGCCNSWCINGFLRPTGAEATEDMEDGPRSIACEPRLAHLASFEVVRSLAPLAHTINPKE